MVMRVSKDDFSLETLDRIAYQLFVIKGSFTVKNLLEIRNVISELMDASVNNIIFDLHACEEMDSSGIGLLGNLLKRLSDREGNMGILNPSDKIYKLLMETGLANVLKFFSSLESIDEHFEI